MNRIKRLSGLGLAMAILAMPLAAPAVEIEGQKPLIQLAILLDTSNSMDGLIAQAKSELWGIVNEFLTVTKDGRRPDLHVALYEYGNNNLDRGEGYVRQVLAFTDDLDEVSKQLFALRTKGGSEYCGWVIRDAVEGLQWATSGDALKLIFIAGNEPFTQGGVDYRQSCKAAIEKGIIVNTIFCGPLQKGISGMWKDGSVLADGKYMNIDQNRVVAHIEAPQDKEIARLGLELNKTYIAYGAKGEEGLRRQVEQETNAQSAFRGAFLERQITKSSGYYTNPGWDLVDATKEGKVELEALKKADLPEEMQKMSIEEREAFVKDQAAKRAEIQAKIKKLNEQRTAYVAAKRKEAGTAGDDTLDKAMIKAIRAQAVKKEFKFR